MFYCFLLIIIISDWKNIYYEVVVKSRERELRERETAIYVKLRDMNKLIPIKNT